MLVCILYYHRIGQVEIVAGTSSSSDTLNQHMIRCLFCNCQYMKREACYLVKRHLTAIWHQRRKTIATVKGQPDLPYTAHRCCPHLDVKRPLKSKPTHLCAIWVHLHCLTYDAYAHTNIICVMSRIVRHSKYIHCWSLLQLTMKCTSWLYIRRERLAFCLHGICWIILPNGVVCPSECRSPASHWSD